MKGLSGGSLPPSSVSSSAVLPPTREDSRIVVNPAPATPATPAPPAPPAPAAPAPAPVAAPASAPAPAPAPAPATAPIPAPASRAPASRAPVAPASVPAPVSPAATPIPAPAPVPAPAPAPVPAASGAGAGAGPATSGPPVGGAASHGSDLGNVRKLKPPKRGPALLMGLARAVASGFNRLIGKARTPAITSSSYSSGDRVTAPSGPTTAGSAPVRPPLTPAHSMAGPPPRSSSSLYSGMPRSASLGSRRSTTSFDDSSLLGTPRSRSGSLASSAGSTASTPASTPMLPTPVSAAPAPDALALTSKGPDDFLKWLKHIQEVINHLNREKESSGSSSAIDAWNVETTKTAPSVHGSSCWSCAASKIQVEASYDSTKRSNQLVFKPHGEKMSSEEDFKKYFSSMFELTAKTGNVYHLSKDQVGSLINGLATTQKGKREDIVQGLKSALDDSQISDHFKKSFGEATFNTIKTFVDIEAAKKMGSAPPSTKDADPATSPSP